MAFQQFKLERSFNQSRGIFNKYAYKSTADSIATVTSANYFAESRFADDDGWIEGIVDCECSDGFIIGQLSSSNTLSQVVGGGSSIPNIIEVTQASDIEDLAVGGIVNITVDTTFDCKLPVVIDVIFVITNDATLLFVGASGAGANITYTGTGTFITGGGTFRMSFMALISTSTGTLFNIFSGFNLAVQNSALIGWDDLGSVSNVTSLANRFAAIIDCTTGFVVTDTGIDILDVSYDSALIGPVYSIFGLTELTHNAKGVKGPLNASSSFVRVDPGINNLTSVNIAQSNITIGQLFDTSGGAAGVFTSVTNSSTVAEPITSVIDSPTTPGRARFLFSGPPNIDIGEIAILSTFAVETTYNVTGPVVDSDLNSYFEIDGVDFTDTDTGQFDTNAIRFVEAGTAIVVGDTFVADTDEATTYDGGFVVFSASAGAFVCNGVFNGSETGTYNTAGVSEKDPRVLSLGNAGFPNSQINGAVFINNNAVLTSGIVNNTFQDIVFGTAGSALVASAAIERFKLIDELNGTLEFTGNEPFSGKIGYNFSVDSTGGSQEFRFKFVIDRGAGFIDLVDNVEALAEVGTTASSVSKGQDVSMVKGDHIKPQITRNAGTSDITMRYASINIFT